MTFLLLVGVTDSPYSFGCATLRSVLESRIVIVDGSGPFHVRSIATQGILTHAHAFSTSFFTRGIYYLLLCSRTSGVRAGLLLTRRWVRHVSSSDGSPCLGIER
jgi:hypothetical protein